MLTLDGDWTLAYGPAEEARDPADPALARWPTIAARVPGNLELDLVAAGLAADPAVGDGAWRMRAWEDRAWWYRRAFTAPAPELGAGDRLELVFDGLDCFATVWLNGVRVGASANALVARRFDVTAALRAGENRIAVRLEPAAAVGRERVPSTGEFHIHSFGWESLAARKPAHAYGWDILPRLMLGGIVRPVRIELVPAARLREVAWSTVAVDPAKRTASVLAIWDAAIPAGAIGSWRVRQRIERDGVAAWRHEAPLAGAHGSAVVPLAGVDAWWPRGWGEPTLYDAVVELVDGDGRVRDSDRRRIGLRAIELRRADPEPGAAGDFCIVVNGQRLFARGTNWVPLDALHARDAGHRDAALALLWTSGGNLVRMWGGGIYEDDEVYDWCDEHGILVWQDFALACAIYPQDDGMRSALRDEAEAVARRLRHHACLALWCGGNETDSTCQWAGLAQDPNRDALTRAVLPEVLRALDPLRPYLPSSPYLSPAALAMPASEVVEDHLWGPRDDWLGPYYAGSRAIFVSEIGWHGCPAPASLAAMQPPGAALWPIAGNPIWLPQAVSPVAQDSAHAWRLDLIARQAALVTPDPLATLADFAFASQVAQAEALKHVVERARARKGAMWGLLWWNLRDGWPVISDAVVDWFGRRKLAFTVVARAQAEVVVVVEQAVDGRHRVVAVNDRLHEVALRARIRDEAGATLLERELVVPANGLIELGALPASAVGALWRVSWSGEAEGAGHFLAGPRPWRLADLRRWYAAIGVTADGFELAAAAR